jgi:transcriptional regulator with XRE-family HTH domain
MLQFEATGANALFKGGNLTLDRKTESNIGRQIRNLRMQRGLSLRALSDLCGLSANTISLIERNENSPNVSSLHQMAAALNVPITDFFYQENQPTTLFVKRDQGVRYSNNGVELESLGIGLPNQQLEPFRLTIEPGSGISREPISHPGHEFVYCLEGELEYYVVGQHYHLKVGDSLLLEASNPHRWHNNSERPTTILLIFQAALSQHLARQSHLDA